MLVASLTDFAFVAVLHALLMELGGVQLHLADGGPLID